jgi:histidyl-tRNA synthetase
VFRNEKPGPGRFRQFMQFDADIVGTPGVAADAEMAMMMADVLDALGLYEFDGAGNKKPLYVVRVNNRKVLDGVLEGLGVVHPNQKLAVLRAMDKADKFPVSEVRKLLTTGRTDESGDHTKGAELSGEQADSVLRLFTSTTQIERAIRFFGREWKKPFTVRKYRQYVMRLLGLKLVPEVVTEGFQELETIRKIVRRAGYQPDRIRIDPSVVRGLEYYTGPVYEAELLFEVPNEKGEIVRFGSVAGGGRYDGLVSRFRGEPVPATGFSIGVSRLTTALKNLGKLDTSNVIAPVVVLVMDRDTDALGRYQKMVTALRDAGIRAEMYLGGSGMKAQMKYADRRGSPCVVIQGGDEREKGEVQIKDMALGEQLSKEIEDNTAWREGRPAQFSVPESELVEAVRKVLEAQKAERG